MIDPAFALFIYCSYLVAVFVLKALGSPESAVLAVAACGFSCVVFEIALTAWRRARSR